jgi:hypothetical protein
VDTIWLFAVKEGSSADGSTGGLNGSTEVKTVCRRLMEAEYTEEPSYWPYGLDMSMVDGGSYLASLMREIV